MCPNRFPMNVAQRALTALLATLAVVACESQAPEAPATSAARPQPTSIKVVTSGGFSAALDILAPIYEQATGVEIEISHGSSMGVSATSMPVRLADGEPADLLIFNDQAFETLREAGYLRAETRVDLGDSVVGMSVRSGAPKPDISTMDAFIAALQAAESIGYSASVSGTYLSTVVFPELDIWEELEPKIHRIVTERVASAVARGDVEIGFQAVSEILSIDGADFVDTIPEEIQQRSTFLAVLPERAENVAGAEALLAFLSSPAAAGIVEATGLQPLVRGSAATLSDRRVHVITSGGFTAAFDTLGPLYQQATGVEVVTEYGSSMGGGPQSIPVRLARGERFDMLILNRPPLDGFTDDGLVRAETRVDLGRSLIGMAVRSGTPHPDISTRDALIETLLAADSVAYSASVSGTRLSTEVFPSLGVWDQIEPKTVRVVGERVATAVVRGDADIGFQQVSAILPVEGADLVGLIPDELQETAFFSAGIMTNAANDDEAERLLAFLSSEAAAPVIDATGLRAVAASWSP